MRPWSKEWFEDCERWLGRILDGNYRHWCTDWDDLPVDETMPEFEACRCFHCPCGTRRQSKFYPWGRRNHEIHDDIFICPRRRIWNFWKHPDLWTW